MLLRSQLLLWSLAVQLCIEVTLRGQIHSEIDSAQWDHRDLRELALVHIHADAAAGSAATMEHILG